MCLQQSCLSQFYRDTQESCDHLHNPADWYLLQITFRYLPDQLYPSRQFFRVAFSTRKPKELTFIRLRIVVAVRRKAQHHAYGTGSSLSSKIRASKTRLTFSLYYGWLIQQNRVCPNCQYLCILPVLMQSRPTVICVCT